MAGDLEEFLKRAAARRQAKTQQQEAAPPPQRAAQRPTPQRSTHVSEYSDRRRERLVRDPSDSEPILVAEIVQEAPDPLAKRRQAIEEAKKEAARAEAEAAGRLAKLQEARGVSGKDNVALTFTGDARADLVRLLRQPGGIKQAILLREILDRPVDRW